MANLGDFDASRVDPATPFEPLPPGKYKVQITQSEMRPTKDGSGSYLWLELDVLEGEHAGRKLFDRLNLNNSNPQTVEIAQRTLSSICYAVGRLKVSDSSDLHLIPMTVDVRVRPPKGEYDASNRIRYLRRDEPPAADMAWRAPTVTPVTTAAPQTAPWKR
jgi:hypothetical protein